MAQRFLGSASFARGLPPEPTASSRWTDVVKEPPRFTPIGSVLFRNGSSPGREPAALITHPRSGDGAPLALALEAAEAAAIGHTYSETAVAFAMIGDGRGLATPSDAPTPCS